MKKINDSSISFGKRLQTLRKSANVAVADIAKELGVSQSTYRDWEQGRSITGQPYIRLSQILGVSLNILFGVVGAKQNDIYLELSRIENSVRELKNKL